MFNRKTRGFTLIELLVVIAIIGILASVVLASLNSARQKGRDTARISDLKQLQLALELSYDSEGEYPDALSVANLVTPGYISVVPSDPSSATADLCSTGAEAGCYQYAQLSGGSDYVIGATLESEDHSVLNADHDDTFGTIDCTDPLYCVKP
jgi:prepilin-type N-terminal cleavage/methylation domain-containing protein